MTLPPDIEDKGPILRNLLDQGPLPIGLALEIARQILRSEEDLPALSSENLLLVRGSDGSPVLRRIDPEGATSAGDREPSETPSDIHAFGVLLYELLTSVHPFQGQTSPAPLSFQVSDRQRRLPPELRALVLATIAEDPEGRFESAAVLDAELAKIQARFPFAEPSYDALTAARLARPARGRRLPSRVSGASSRGILARLLVLCAVLALLLVLWALVPEKIEAPAVRAETPEALQDVQPVANPDPPRSAEIPSGDSPEIRTEPAPAPVRQVRAETPRPSPPRPKRSTEPRLQVAGGAEIFESESAVPLSAPQPRYPEAALGTDTWAEVVVGLTIDETGAVRNPTIESFKIQGSAPASLFQEAALAAARETRYRPAREQGAPVRSWTTLTFTFGSQ